MLIFYLLYDYNLEFVFIRKCNEREWIRVCYVNEGYVCFWEYFLDEFIDKRMLKVEIFWVVIRYIKYLESLLDVSKEDKRDKMDLEVEKRKVFIDEER